MIVCIIQARLGSSRLPGKVLKKILGRPMLSLMLERVRQAKTLNGIVVATTTNPEDAPIVEFAKDEGYAWYRGSPHDVLDRYYQGAAAIGAHAVVRLTADCPLQDPRIIDEVVDAWKTRRSDADFVSNVHPATFPDGLDTEVFSFEALRRAWEETTIAQEREHVTPYLYASGKFRTFNVEHTPDLSRHRWTVDYPDDFDLAKEIFQALYRPAHVFGMEEILDFVEGRGKKFVTNQKYARNAWFQEYQKELMKK